MASKGSEHVPVLVTEVLHYLHPQPHGLYVDATFGSGGHTKAILEKEPTCRVIALDWSEKALETFGEPLQETFGDRITLVWGNFAHLYKLLKRQRVGPVDGILADFGTSQVQIFQEAGFSVYRDTPLDMRMSPAHQKITAAQVLNEFSEEKLRTIFWEYGQERYAKQIVRAIIEQRSRQPFKTTMQLAKLVERAVPRNKKQFIHPATRVFQALRIFVNNELDNIQAFLKSAIGLLKSNGRLVCISFHSLEDRLVKQIFKAEKEKGLATILTDKVVRATEQEIADNPSSRSAKLRALEKR